MAVLLAIEPPELDERAVCAAVVPSGSIVVEGGSGAGQVTRDLIARGCWVEAYDPGSHAWCGPGMRLHRVALAASTDPREYHERAEWWNSGFHPCPYQVADVTTRTMRATTVQHARAACSGNALVLDVEGDELDILAGDLAGFDVVVAELHPLIYGEWLKVQLLGTMARQYDLVVHQGHTYGWRRTCIRSARRSTSQPPTT